MVILANSIINNPNISKLIPFQEERFKIGILFNFLFPEKKLRWRGRNHTSAEIQSNPK